MARIVIDDDLCGGHAVCADEAPEVFRVNDDAKVEVVDPAHLREVPADLLARVRLACTYCPTRAVRLVEG